MVVSRPLDSIKSASNSSNLSEEVSKHCIVSMGGLSLEGMNSLMKVRSLGKTLMDKIVERMVVASHRFKSKGFVISGIESFG